jgi:hypothetical protein
MKETDTSESYQYSQNIYNALKVKEHLLIVSCKFPEL